MTQFTQHRESRDFYMIAVEKGRAPSVIHATLESAETEAKRLIEQHPKRMVYIFKIESTLVPVQEATE